MRVEVQVFVLVVFVEEGRTKDFLSCAAFDPSDEFFSLIVRDFMQNVTGKAIFDWEGVSR